MSHERRGFGRYPSALLGGPSDVDEWECPKCGAELGKPGAVVDGDYRAVAVESLLVWPLHFAHGSRCSEEACRNQLEDDLARPRIVLEDWQQPDLGALLQDPIISTIEPARLDSTSANLAWVKD